MRVAQNCEMLPEPCVSILMDINKTLQLGESISMEEVRGGVKLFYAKRYHKSVRELMKLISQYAEQAGFVKVMKGELEVIDDDMELEHGDARAIFLKKVNECELKKQFTHKVMIMLMSLLLPFLGMIPFASFALAESIIH